MSDTFEKEFSCNKLGNDALEFFCLVKVFGMTDHFGFRAFRAHMDLHNTINICDFEINQREINTSC